MPSSDTLTLFSDEGDNFIQCSTNGTFVIRDSVSNTVKQECTFNVKKHGAFTCLIWIPSKQKTGISKKPKLNKKSDVLLEDASVGFGTKKGFVFVYSSINTEYFIKLVNGHSDVVNDLCWNVETKTLFSCSSDSSVAIWDVVTGKIKSKWKTEDAVHSMCIIDANNLLTGSCSICWWNIVDQTLIKKFTPQQPIISKLLPVYIDDTSNVQYFLSATSSNDRICAWNLNENSRNPIATFVLNSKPRSMEISKSSENKLSLLSVLTKEGSILLFEHVFNGKIEDSILPKSTIHLTSNSKNCDSKSELIPILSAKLSKDLDSCTIAYGSSSKPIFEKVNLVDCPKEFILVKEKCNISEDSKARINEATKLNGNVSPSQKLSLTRSIKSNKRTRKKEDELSISDNETSSEDPVQMFNGTESSSSEENSCSIETSNTLRSDDLLKLLLQGLQTKNNTFLNAALQCGDAGEIRKALCQVPQYSINFFLKYLYEVLKLPRHDLNARKWLKELLGLHLQHLVSCDETTDILNSLKELIKSKRPTETISKICTLRGLLAMYQKQIDGMDAEEKMES